MKRLGLFALLLGVGLFAMGCEREPEPVPTTTTPATHDEVGDAAGAGTTHDDAAVEPEPAGTP